MVNSSEAGRHKKTKEWIEVRRFPRLEVSG